MERDQQHKGRVFVGISGGVDSSTAATLLRRDGYEVTGVFIKVWHPDFLPCTWKEERVDAMRVCARLGIPFLMLDLEKEYKEHVADYLIEGYRRGRTPNPDVMCNKSIKFGSFLKFAMERGADYIATGHYARVREKDGAFELLRSTDDRKDQSYFLWTLSQKELSRTLFPVGVYHKSRVRALAAEFELPTAQKKDSQGICFLGPVDLRSFLKNFITVAEGAVVNESGEVVGSHDGAILYTVGQRHGFTVSEASAERSPYYIVAKDPSTNTLVVSHDPTSPAHARREVALEQINWISGEAPRNGAAYRARYRHQGALHPCTLEKNTLVFDEPQSGLAAGQSVVLYDDDVCLGGGIIS